MWARITEILLGVWLMASTVVIPATHADSFAGAASLIAGGLVILLAGLSYWRPTRYAHLFTVAVATAMIGFGRFESSDPAPLNQNLIFIGLLLVMFAIVPNYASRPPQGWRILQQDAATRS